MTRCIHLRHNACDLEGDWTLQNVIFCKVLRYNPEAEHAMDWRILPDPRCYGSWHQMSTPNQLNTRCRHYSSQLSFNAVKVFRKQQLRQVPCHRQVSESVPRFVGAGSGSAPPGRQTGATSPARHSGAKRGYRSVGDQLVLPKLAVQHVARDLER